MAMISWPHTWPLIIFGCIIAPLARDSHKINLGREKSPSYPAHDCDQMILRYIFWIWNKMYWGSCLHVQCHCGVISRLDFGPRCNIFFHSVCFGKSPLTERMNIYIPSLNLQNSKATFGFMWVKTKQSVIIYFQTIKEFLFYGQFGYLFCMKGSPLVKYFWDVCPSFSP